MPFSQWRRPGSRAQARRGERRQTLERLESRRHLAATPAPLGDEFRVSVATEANQAAPSVAGAADYFVAAWHTDAQDGSGRGVYARLFVPAGGTAGPEFRVNIYSPLDQMRPVVAASAHRFVVVWQSEGQDGDRTGVYGRLFDNTGAPLSGEFPVNSLGEGRQGTPAVAMAPDGQFVVAWTGDGPDSAGWDVYARRFAADGTPLGQDLLVNNEDVQRHQTGADVGIAADGRFVVCWQGPDPTFEASEVFARRFGADGRPDGGAFAVTTAASPGVQEPAIAVEPDGDFVIAWQAPDGRGATGDDLYARRFTADGAPRDLPFPLNADLEGDQASPALAVAADGAFVATWHGAGEAADIFTRRFDAAGIASAAEVRVNAHLPGEQSAASVALSTGGNLLAAWQSAGQDGSGLGVYGRYLVTDDPPPPAVTGVFVGGTAWTAAFRQRAADASGAGPAADGFLVGGGGAAQLNVLPWAGIDRFSVRFSRDVLLDAPLVRVGGARVADYPITHVAYDRQQFTYTFTLGRPVVRDRLTLRIDGTGDGADVARDAATGRALDGEWADGVDSYPSGDGTAGGDFVFGLNVLPGDVTGDGRVNGADVAAVRTHLATGGGTIPPVSRYSVFHDPDGSGRVDAWDYVLARSRQSTLPLPPPATVPGVAGEDVARRAAVRRQIFSTTPLPG